jgi:ribosome-dependent ATPase
MDARFRSGELTLVIEIPSGFGRDLESLRSPDIAVWIDGAMPFRGETAKSYVSALALQYAKDRVMERLGPNGISSAYLGGLNVETRFRYNQSFKSVNAMVPSVIMLMLILIPAIMSAVAVVREKETGSIANFRSTPTSKFEFLFGKQLPYVAVSMVTFVLLVLLAIVMFGVPIKGSFATLTLGTLLYVFAATGFGQLVSTFTRTQAAALFATAILTVIPAVNFSGLLMPVSSLSGGASFFGLSFPAAWYQPITIGSFTKALGLSDLWFNMSILAMFALFYLIAAQLLLKKQET